MQRFFIHFSYDGTHYHGWQIQPNGMSVQEMMTSVMKQLFGPDFQLTGAGRTDSGVHASCMYAHFDSEKDLGDLKALAYKVNYMMPPDIAVYSIRKVRPDANARFDALSRTYEYRMSPVKDPFSRFYTAPFYGQLDVVAMNQAAAVLFDYDDFTSFSKLHTDVKTNICTIMKAEWEWRGEELVFIIQADRFLRNMVRAVVGTLLEVGRGKLDVAGFRQIIELKDRCAAGASVEARGLFLVDVAYPDSIFVDKEGLCG